MEYTLRVWVCTFHLEFNKPITGRIKYILTPLALIDLLVLLPFYIPIFVHLDLRFLRLFRVFRIVLILKLGKFSEGLQRLIRVVYNKKEELFISLMLVFFLLIVSSSLIYYAECYVQPESFPSIISAMWWAVATLTTVGYGDVYPKTTLGKIIAGFVSLLGIGLFALPSGIIASGLVEEVRKKKEKKTPLSSLW